MGKDEAEVREERKVLSRYGGGCHQKIGVGVLVRPYGRVTYLRGLTDAGVRLDEVNAAWRSGLPDALQTGAA